MDFDQLTRDLETQDRTVKLCAHAIRKRAEWMQRNGYSDNVYLLVRSVAYWLESDSGRETMLDLSVAYGVQVGEGEKP